MRFPALVLTSAAAFWPHGSRGAGVYRDPWGFPQRRPSPFGWEPECPPYRTIQAEAEAVPGGYRVVAVVPGASDRDVQVRRGASGLEVWGARRAAPARCLPAGARVANGVETVVRAVELPGDADLVGAQYQISRTREGAVVQATVPRAAPDHHWTGKQVQDESPRFGYPARDHGATESTRDNRRAAGAPHVGESRAMPRGQHDGAARGRPDTQGQQYRDTRGRPEPQTRALPKNTRAEQQGPRPGAQTEYQSGADAKAPRRASRRGTLQRYQPEARSIYTDVTIDDEGPDYEPVKLKSAAAGFVDSRGDFQWY